jgi:hypothetical protein
MRRSGGVLLDQVDGHTLLVYLDARTSTPAALFVTSSRARAEGSTVRLDNRQVIRDGLLFDGSGRRAAVERRMQVFTRWYSFALTFRLPTSTPSLRRRRSSVVNAAYRPGFTPAPSCAT